MHIVPDATSPAQPAETPVQPITGTPAGSQPADKPRLSDRPLGQRVENREFAAFARRIIRAHSRRVADGDVEALTDLVALASTVDDAIADAVRSLHADYGYSYTEIADRLGVTRQAVRQRWGSAS